MKKLLGVIFAFSIVFFIANTAVLADNNNGDYGVSSEVEQKTEELKDEFPEFSSAIDHANMKAKVPTIQPNETENKPEVVFTETRSVDDNTEYTLQMYSDGSYVGMQSIVGSYSWSGGSVSSGTGYSNYTSRTLSVFQSGGKYAMTIYPVSYGLVQGGYDSFTNYGTAVLNGKPISAYPTKKTENSSGPAYAYFNGTNSLIIGEGTMAMQVRIEVGSDASRVYLNGVRL